MLGLLVQLLVMLLIVGVNLYILSIIPMDATTKQVIKVIKVIIICIVAIYLIYFLIGFLPNWNWSPHGSR